MEIWTVVNCWLEQVLPLPPFRSYCFSVFISLKFSVRCFVEYIRLYQFPISFSPSLPLSLYLSLHCKCLLFWAAFFFSSYVLLLFSLFFFPFFSLFSILASRSFLPSYMKECHKWYTLCGYICGADLEFFQLSFHTITQNANDFSGREMVRWCFISSLLPSFLHWHFIVVITTNAILHFMFCKLSILVAWCTELYPNTTNSLACTRIHIASLVSIDNRIPEPSIAIATSHRP